MTSHRRHLGFWSSTSKLGKPSGGQHNSLERMTLSCTRREKRRDDVTVTSFPVHAKQHGKWSPTFQTSPRASTDTKSIACLLESPKTRSFWVYDVHKT